MKKLKFEKNGDILSGNAQLVDDQIWIHFGGRTFTVSALTESSSAKTKSSKSAALKTGNIISPMPGKITKILVKLGDHVVENQNVLVMEAMKMEYALKAQVTGTVKDICFNVDSQVALGTTLAVIEKTDSK